MTELGDRVGVIQGRTVLMRNRAMDALVALIGDIKQAKEASADVMDWDRKGLLLPHLHLPRALGVGLIHGEQEGRAAADW